MGHGMILPHLENGRCGKVWQVWHRHGPECCHTTPLPPERGVGCGKACSASEVRRISGGAV